MYNCITLQKYSGILLEYSEDINIKNSKIIK